MKTDTVKGFKDFSGKEAIKRAELTKILMETFDKYGFEPAETPIIEYEEFVRGENPDDEAVSNVFKLQDRGKRKLALRYEFTFQLNRLAKNKKLPYKRYQIGEVFRDEPVSANRFRQFIQCDIDTIGSSVKDEAEILACVKEVLDKLNIKFTIYINNRKLLREILDSLKIKKKEEAIREFDKLDKLPEKVVKENLKKYKAEKLLGILRQNPGFFKKYKSFSEIEELIDYCEFYGFKEGSVRVAPFLARGLSYYNGNIFEVKAKGIKETIVAGGSYMVDKVQATGISFGLERLASLAKIKLEKEKILIWPNGKDKQAIKITQKLRKNNICEIIYKTNMKKVFEYANSSGFSKLIFYDKKVSGFKTKDLKTGKESLLK